MGARPMIRETRVQYLHPGAGWVSPLFGITDWFRDSNFETRIVERYVTEWAPVADGERAAPEGWHIATMDECTFAEMPGYYCCTHQDCEDEYEEVPGTPVTRDGKDWSGDALCAKHMAMPTYDGCDE